MTAHLNQIEAGVKGAILTASVVGVEMTAARGVH